MAADAPYLDKIVQFTKDEQNIFASSHGVSRTFCGSCGTPISYEAEWNGDIVIGFFIGTLDEPGKFPPQRHVAQRNRIGWFDAAATLPRFLGFLREGQKPDSVGRSNIGAQKHPIAAGGGRAAKSRVVRYSVLETRLGERLFLVGSIGPEPKRCRAQNSFFYLVGLTKLSAFSARHAGQIEGCFCLMIVAPGAKISLPVRRSLLRQPRRKFAFARQ